MVSAFASENEEDEAKALGVSDFLHKPITASLVFDALARQFDKSYSAQAIQGGQKEGDEAEAERRLRGVRILMAEDNEANQFVAEELLSAVGARLDIADNGREALEKLEVNLDYDAVLMDMQMPVMDGLTAAREIRRRWPECQIPIIALTANAMKGDMERCLKAGMNDYVSKPIDRKDLIMALTRWIESKPRSERGIRRSSIAHPCQRPPKRKRFQNFQTLMSQKQWPDLAFPGIPSRKCSFDSPMDNPKPSKNFVKRSTLKIGNPPDVTPIPSPAPGATCQQHNFASKPKP